MEGGPPRFPQPFTGAVVLGSVSQGGSRPFAYGAFTLYGAAFQQTSAKSELYNSPRSWRTPLDTSHDPGMAKAATMAPYRFRLFPVRSPLLGESRLISFPPATKRFCFAECSLPQESGMTGLKACRVSPLGHPGLKGSLRLHPAYRSLARPSSPPAAEASTPSLY